MEYVKVTFLHFIVWFAFPAILHIIEKFLRALQGSRTMVVRAVYALSDDVMCLELEKGSFEFKAGQYCFINVSNKFKYLFYSVPLYQH